MIEKNHFKKYTERVKSLRDLILTNIIFLGQVPCLPEKSYERKNQARARVFLDRLAEAQADECTKDVFGNPYAILKGKAESKPPIMLVAHMDTTPLLEKEAHFSITAKHIIGPGLIDNSLGVGVLMSMPDIVRVLDIQFESDLILVGLVESLKEGNLKSIRDILGAWDEPLRAGICVEGGERGRLNYFSESMIRADVHIDIPMELGWKEKHGLNAIIVINDVISNILKIRLPQRPKTEIIFGELRSGYKHGEIPLSADMGFEIHSETDEMVREVYEKVDEICSVISHKVSAKIRLHKVSNVKAANLTYHHPLVKSTISIMDALGITPQFESSESELSVFLSNNIPAVTIGLASGDHYHTEMEKVKIHTLYGGIVQLMGVLEAVDQGVCDEELMAE